MNQAPSGQGQHLSLSQELNFMPMILELVEAIPNATDQHEMNRKVANFRAKIQACKDLLNKIPGLDTSPEEQEKELQTLKEELARKQELLERFSSLAVLTSNAVKKEAS